MAAPNSADAQMAGGEKMDVEKAELQLKEMAHSEQHYFNR